MRLDVALDELLPHPVEVVWQALTDAAAISEWLMVTSDFEARVGAKFRLETRHLSPTGWVDAEVVELEPPRWMAWSWSSNDGNAPSRVTFELGPEGNGTRLRLIHEGEIDPEIGSVLVAGWPGRLELLADVAGRKGGDR
jgi:uncharacterized protein YndB with AHSA1/START domain